jgi:DNA-binding response OmpR family regulator
MSSSVLVVENYPDLCSAIVDTLARSEYACESAATAEDAIVKLREHHYEAILLAPCMPIRSDPVMRFLTESQPGEVHKVILMTDPPIGEETDPEDCRVLVKPFNNEQLFAQLRPLAAQAVNRIGTPRLEILRRS